MVHHSMRGISVEGLELVGFHGGFIFVQMCQWVLGAIVMCIVVRINGLCLQTSNGVKLFDGCRTQASQCAEHSALDLCDLGILHGIDQGVLSLCCVVLKLLCCILFAKRRNLIE